MKNKVAKAIIRFLITLLIGTALAAGVTICAFILTDGMYLMGVPAIDDVHKVTISYPQVTDEIKEVTDEEQIALAVKLTGSLKYSLFEKAVDNEKSMITITYFLDNGDTVSVSANRETVWWKGKAYAIKEKGMFIQLTEGIFFLNELNAK